VLVQEELGLLQPVPGSQGLGRRPSWLQLYLHDAQTPAVPIPEINHLFKDARERTTQAMIDYLVQERGVRMIKREDTYICPECII